MHFEMVRNCIISQEQKQITSNSYLASLWKGAFLSRTKSRRAVVLVVVDDFRPVMFVCLSSERTSCGDWNKMAARDGRERMGDRNPTYIFSVESTYSIIMNYRNRY